MSVLQSCIHKNQRIIHAEWEWWWECQDCTALVKTLQPGDVERYERELKKERTMNSEVVTCECGQKLGSCEANCLKCECFCERASLCCGRSEHYAVEGMCGCGEWAGFKCGLHGVGWSDDGLCPAIFPVELAEATA